MRDQSLSPTQYVPTSLMTHSMGNYILVQFAVGGAKGFFDDFYMVAADVRAYIFSEKLNSRAGMESTPPPGVSIVGQLKGHGKVHVFFSTNDKKAMGARFFANCVKPGLGAKGCDLDEIDSRIKGRVVNVDCSAEEYNVEDEFGGHEYMFVEGAIRYYEQAH